MKTPKTFRTNAAYQRHRIRTTPKSLAAGLKKLLLGYGKSEGVNHRSAIRDALTDLRHLCDIYGLDFGELDGGAYQGYLEEAQYHKEAVNG